MPSLWLVTIALFETILGILRTYLFRTPQSVPNAVSWGARLFRHLFRFRPCVFRFHVSVIWRRGPLAREHLDILT